MTFAWGGQQFGPGDQTKFRAWLKAHGHNYAAWSAAHQQAAATFVSPEQQAAITQATAAEAPAILGIQQQQTAAQNQVANTLKNNQGFSEALARIFASIAPMTNSTYSNAAGETGALAKGFGSADDAAAAANQAQVGDILAKAGSPAGAVGAVNAQLGGPVGDVTYGLNGFIPASGLAREGAAFGSAAAQLPAYAGGLGMQNAAAIQSQAATQDKAFMDQIAQERSKIPGEANDILQQEASNEIQRQAAAAQQSYLEAQTAGQRGATTGIDPITGQPTAAMQKFWATLHQQKVLTNASLKQKKNHDAAAFAAATAAGLDPNAALSAKYGVIVDSHGNVIPGADGNPIKIYTPPKAPKAPSQAGVHARESAFSTAQKEMYTDVHSLYTTPPADPNHLPPPGYTPSKTVPPTYIAAKKYLFAKYSYLLKYASRSGRYKLKNRLNTVIDSVLVANHIYPAGGGPTGENG